MWPWSHRLACLAGEPRRARVPWSEAEDHRRRPQRKRGRGKTLILEAQSTLRATSVTIDQGAAFADVGTVAADLVNDGRLGTTGTDHVTGNYTQGPGATLFSGFGSLLTVTGTATLAGSVSATETFAKTGDTTQLITFGSLAGDFTRHSLGLGLRTGAHEIDGIQVPSSRSRPRPCPRARR